MKKPNSGARAPRGWRIVRSGKIHDGDKCIAGGWVHGLPLVTGDRVPTITCIIIRKASPRRPRSGKGRKS